MYYFDANYINITLVGTKKVNKKIRLEMTQRPNI